MYSLNRATIIGNLTKDPEIRATQNGTSVANFSIATNQAWTDAEGKKQERTEFHNVVAWGKLAEICGQYLAKGRRVYAEGRIQTREWETQDGQKRRTTEIVLDSMIMLDRPLQGDETAAQQPQSAGTTGGSSAATPSAVKQGTAVKPEDIPF